MKELDEKTSEALVKLGGLPYFQAFLDWLGDSLDEQRNSNDVLDGPQLYRGQGCALTLKEILEKADSADKVLTRIMTNKSRRVRRGLQ